MSEGKRACVVGAGLGGLALAIRLQAAGVSTTLVEARDRPGGRAAHTQRDGFTFDAAPMAIARPESFRELWDIGGHDMAADVELMPVDAGCRFSWPDGTHVDFTRDEAALRRQIARLDPADIAGYDAFLSHCEAVGREVGDIGATALAGVMPMLGAVPALARHRAWRPVYETVSRFVRSEKLRQALSFRMLMAGANPLTAGPACAPLPSPREESGTWWPRGGVNRLVAAMLRQFERLGGEARMHDPVVAIETSGARATGIETLSGWRARFDAVASNADIVHSYRDLLRGSPRGPQMARRLGRKRFGPSLFVVHLGIEGSWPGIPHHMVLFGAHYESFLGDVFERGVLPAEFPISLHHPTVTDPSLAPEGKSTLQAVVPVAHRGKLAIDWEQVGPLMEQRVLAEIERRLIPDLSDRIVAKFHYGPRDFAMDLNAHLGSAFGLEPVLTQAAGFRPRNRDETIGNFYLVGAGTRPGCGVPGALDSARETAAMMLGNLMR